MDAMVVLAETLLASGPAPAQGGARHQVNLHSDLDALVDDTVAARKPAHPDGQAIPEFCPAPSGAAEKVGGMHRAEIPPTTTPHWDGERLGLPYAVSVLTQSSTAPSTDPPLN